MAFLPRHCACQESKIQSALYKPPGTSTGAPVHLRPVSTMQRFHMLLAFGMLVTGSINTIATKIADWQSAYGADENKPCPVWSSSSSKTESEPAAPCQFIHPFFQALCMFLGEFLSEFLAEGLSMAEFISSIRLRFVIDTGVPELL